MTYLSSMSTLDRANVFSCKGNHINEDVHA